MIPRSCPHCGQPLRQERVGIFLPPVKCLIFDLIKAAGDVWLNSEELAHTLAYDSPARSVSRNTIKAHVSQINDILAETDYRIRRDGRRWCLVKVRTP